MIDPRIDPRTPHIQIVQKIADIIRDYGPITYSDLALHLPNTTGLTNSYLSHVLKKLKSLGMIESTKKGHPRYVWSFIPQGEKPAPFVEKDPSVKVMLKNMGSYRVVTLDGRKFDRMEFHRRDLTWSNKRVTLEMDEVCQLAYIPDHAAYKSGTRHLELYAHKFVDIKDCIIPKLKGSDEESPAWVNPIRARVLGIQGARESTPVKRVELKKDYGSPHR